MPVTLTRKRLAEAAVSLAAKDEDLARVLKTDGPPPLWGRKPGFATLIRIILEQQVSLASANATYRRLTQELTLLTPETVVTAGASTLRSFGITRQKAGYFLNVAEAIQTGSLDLKEVEKVDDETASVKLTGIKGVGPWTAQVYLLMALRRPDIWPAGDIALASAAQNLRGLHSRPNPEELAEIADEWRPHRATAARMLWQYYLNGMPTRAPTHQE